MGVGEKDSEKEEKEKDMRRRPGTSMVHRTHSLYYTAHF
jgi:hypothetical protein